jgi:site-specific DNA-cytosine methylase
MKTIKEPLRELALFTGAGGGILASQLLRWRTRCGVEIEEFCSDRLLQRQAEGHLERFPIWPDIRTFDGREWFDEVEIVSGGFPCQDISSAGNRAGLAGRRSGLWFEMLRVISEVRPCYVFAENSQDLRGRGLGTILSGLAAMGYDARWGMLGARLVGAPHKRNRCWLVASHSDRCRERKFPFHAEVVSSPAIACDGGDAHRIGLGRQEPLIEDPSLETSTGGINYALREWLLGWPLNWSSPERVTDEAWNEWAESHSKLWPEIRTEILRRKALRAVQLKKATGEASHRSRSEKQRSKKRSGLVSLVSSKDPHGCGRLADCEAGEVPNLQVHIPTEEKPAREDLRKARVSSRERKALIREKMGRTKVTGNGQVPAVAALAWTILTDGFEERSEMKNEKIENNKHSSKSVEYGTPKEIVKAAREAMGSIDLDPATSERFNALYIRAPKIFTKKTDGLNKKWRGNVILNPPGGKVDADGKPIDSRGFGFSSSHFWFDKLIDQVKKGNVKKAIFVAFSMEVLQVAQQNNNFEGMHICIPSKRVAFLSKKGKPMKGPTHANAIVGIGIDGHVFNQAFKHIGFCATVRTKL